MSSWSKKLVRSSSSGAAIGTAGLGAHGVSIGSVKENVHDGDTIFVRALTNISIRFLGLDTPEISFRPPGSGAFTETDEQVWVDYLADPFTGWNAERALGAGLVAHLANKVGPAAAANHHAHAEAAHRKLERLIETDVERHARGNVATFRFFLRYAHDALDRYGRLLAYINVDLPRPPRPATYNERLLESGAALPYFIWPNLDPFKKQKALTEAVPGPRDVPALAETGALGDARRWVREARTARRGVFAPEGAPGGALKLEAFELRFLARQAPPDRWVLDLSGSHGSRLVPPTRYFEIANPEDRLFIPSEFVGLFTQRSWIRSARPAR
jgi:hypothetical protein